MVVKKENIKEPILYEFGIRDIDPGEVWYVVRAFYVPLKNGPAEIVRPGQRIRLSSGLGAQAFEAGRVEPVSMPSTFEALRNFRTTDGAGEWLDVSPGDVVRVEKKEEALSLMRQGMIRPKGE